MPTLNILINRGKALQIDNIICEIGDRENHEFTNEISEYPVQDGYSITDSIKSKPTMFTAHAIFTTNPISGGNQSGRDKLVFNKFLELGGFAVTKTAGVAPVKIADPKKIDVISELYTYVDMYIKSIKVLRVPSNAGGLDVEIVFKQLRVKTNEFTQVRIVKDVKAGNNMKKKIQNKTPTGEGSGATNPVKTSYLRSLIDGKKAEINTGALQTGIGAVQ